MGVWFLGNMVAQRMTSTSAFEVFANRRLVSANRSRLGSAKIVVG
jgi:hypothetical protein